MNRNAFPRRQLHTGFTLIELLVVIVIIAILASLAVPVTNLVMLKAATLQTKATMKDLQVAINHYRTEYNRYPIDPSLASGSADTDIEPFLTDGTMDPNIINILLAQIDTSVTPNMNARGIKFIDLPQAKNNLFGVVDPSGGEGTGAPVQLVDKWGMPYTIALDTNYDNRIENPDLLNTDSKISSTSNPPKMLSASAIIYSYGPDKTPQTKDDITSWR